MLYSRITDILICVLVLAPSVIGFHLEIGTRVTRTTQKLL